MARTGLKFYAILSASLLFFCALSILVISFINAVAFTNYPFAGFFFQPNLYVSFTERTSWEGQQKGIRPLDRLLAINDKKMSSGTQALKTIQRSNPDSELKFTFQEQNDNIKEVKVKLSKFTLNDLSVTFLLPFLIGLFFLIMGFAVFLKNPLKKVASINFLSSLFITLFYSTSLDANTTYWFYRLFALYPLVGASAVHLILAVTASSFLKRFPITEAVPYIVAGLIVAFQQYYLYSESSATWIYMISPLFLVGCVILNIGYLITYYITTKDLVSRRKTRFYLTALLFGTMIPALWSITFAFGSPLISLDWAIALSVLYPILTGYAITRDDLFNVESIVRTSIEYLLFTCVVIVAYLVVVTLTSMALQHYISSTNFVNTIITILVVVVAMPFRKKIQDFIYRNFYPEHYDTLAKTNEISTALSYVRDKATLGAIIERHFTSAMSLETAGLIYASKDKKLSLYSSRSGIKTIELSIHAMQRIFTKAGVVEYVNDVFEISPPRATRKEINELKTLSPQYFLPIGKEKVRAIMVLGAKQNKEQGFIKEDFELLKVLYPQINTAFINAELHEQKAEQEKLIAIGEMASVLIHEIKNPLGIIKISSSAIRKRLNNDVKSEEVLGFIEEEVDRMNNTITSFLNYAKPKQPIKKSYSIQELKAYIENIRPEIEKNGHKLTAEYKVDDLSFHVDPDHLKQILLNLILNAKDLSPANSNIDFIVDVKDNVLNIHVSDSGPGISPEVERKLFEPFFTTKEHGTGLGLSVTKQLVTVNGGDIRWENKALGGAIFTVEFQLTECTENDTQNPYS